MGSKKEEEDPGRESGVPALLDPNGKVLKEFDDMGEGKDEESLFELTRFDTLDCYEDEFLGIHWSFTGGRDNEWVTRWNGHVGIVLFQLFVAKYCKFHSS